MRVCVRVRQTGLRGLRYLQVQRVKAGVRPAANWAVSLNLHGIEQVHVTEAGGPAHV